MRVYYTGSVEDGPRVVFYNGSSFVWHVPGFRAAKKLLPVKDAFGKDVVRQDKLTGKLVPIMKKQWVNGDRDPKKRESFLDLEADAVRWVFTQAHNDDGKLKLEKDFRKTISVDDLLAQKADLEALIAMKQAKEKAQAQEPEPESDEEKPVRRGPGRPPKAIL